MNSFERIFLMAVSIAAFFVNGEVGAQSLTISESTVFIKKKVFNQMCSPQNPNPPFFINGTYHLASSKFNGRNQYLMVIPTELTTSICVSNIFTYTLPNGTNYLRIRWSGTNWVVGFITSINTFQLVAIFDGDTPLPVCNQYSQNNNAKIEGEDCYCQSTMNLSGTATSTQKYAQTTISSIQTVGNTTHLLYQAGNSITLNTGFQALAGGIFEAKIGGCN